MTAFSVMVKKGWWKRKWCRDCGVSPTPGKYGTALSMPEMMCYRCRKRKTTDP